MTPVDILMTHLLTRIRVLRRDERGLSQSTENAILLAGAVTIAALIVTTVTAYVKARLP